eukprot:4380843-Lingulodinium_polyedra.AAC.1
MGEPFDTYVDAVPPALESVTGDAITHWGRRTLECSEASTGACISLQADVAGIAHPVASVERMNERGMSVWMPSEHHAGSWLVAADGTWTQLQGPCLLGQGG